ncbi:MAG TPA: hypothetical protein VGL38_07845 [bacterium]|jgi:hypothetical protein
MTFRNMIDATGELKRLLDFAYPDVNNAEVCRTVRCPVKQRFELMMEQAVTALREPKGSFKSKEIADLRKRFEHLLTEERPVPSRPQEL